MHDPHHPSQAETLGGASRDRDGRRERAVRGETRRLVRLVVILAACGALAYGALQSYRFSHPTGPAREWDNGAAVTPWPLPEFLVRDDAGKVFRREDLLGRVWIVDLLSLHCVACLPLSGEIAKLQDELPADSVSFASFSVDLGDDPGVLRSHRKRFPHVAAERWRITPAELELAPTLAVAFGAARTRKDAVEGLLALTPRFYLVDRKARVRGAYYGTSAKDRQRLVDDARALIAAPH